MYEPSTRPGAPLPHAWIDDEDGRRHALKDLVAPGRFLLIAGEDGAAWCDAARQLAAAADLPLDAVRIAHIDGDLYDPRCTWLRHRGITPEGAVLVRPDRFVGWRSAEPVEQPLEASYLHTGGTTGAPKLAARTHRNEVANAWMIGTRLDADGAVFAALPLFHTNALVVTLLAPLLRGQPVVWAGARSATATRRCSGSCGSSWSATASQRCPRCRRCTPCSRRCPWTPTSAPCGCRHDDPRTVRSARGAISARRLARSAC